jgi:hypothetical protein
MASSDTGFGVLEGAEGATDALELRAVGGKVHTTPFEQRGPRRCVGERR